MADDTFKTVLKNDKKQNYRLVNCKKKNVGFVYSVDNRSHNFRFLPHSNFERVLVLFPLVLSPSDETISQNLNDYSGKLKKEILIIHPYDNY